MTTTLLILASLALIASFGCLLRTEDMCSIRIGKIQAPFQSTEGTRTRRVFAFGLYLLAIVGYLMTSQQWAQASSAGMPTPQPLTLQDRLSHQQQRQDLMQEVLGVSID